MPDKNIGAIEAVKNWSAGIGWPIETLDDVDSLLYVIRNMGDPNASAFDLLSRWKERMEYHRKAEFDLTAKRS